jgi:hypothetical protein
VANNLGQLYLDVDLADLEETDGDTSLAEDKREQLLGINLPDAQDTADYTFFEIHVQLEIDIDPVTEGQLAPYIVTIQACSGKVLAIYRGWNEADTEFFDRVPMFSDYRYNPGMGSYGLGFLQMLGSSAETATAGTRQLIDAGTLSNMPTGFKDANLNIKGDSGAMNPGEWRDADVAVGKLSDAFFSVPYAEPSATLAALVESVVKEARGLIGLNELRPADMSTQAPVGTTLALLERALKPLSAVQARVHRYMRHELTVMRDMTVMFYEVLAKRKAFPATVEELKRFDIQPVSDSNASTLTQRIAQFQMVSQMAEKVPDKFNLDKLAEYGLNMIDFPATDEILNTADKAVPVDPVTENGAILVGTATKAFVHQDHEAHLKTHQAMFDDPLVQKLVGQSPQASAIQGAWDAHMREHAAMLYITQTQAELGMEIPKTQTPEQERELAGYLEAASQKVLQKHQQLAAQQQAQQQAEDPVMKQQADQLKIDQGELMLKGKTHDDKMRLEVMKVVADMDDKEANQLLSLFKQVSDGINVQEDRADARSVREEDIKREDKTNAQTETPTTQ